MSVPGNVPAQQLSNQWVDVSSLDNCLCVVRRGIVKKGLCELQKHPRSISQMPSKVWIHIKPLMVS
jgi:hypothetical protein